MEQKGVFWENVGDLKVGRKKKKKQIEDEEKELIDYFIESKPKSKCNQNKSAFYSCLFD